MPLARVGATPAASRAGFHVYGLKWFRLIGLCSRVVNIRSSSPYRVPAEVLGQLGGRDVGQWKGPGLGALRRFEDQHAPHDLDLLLHVDLLAQEVDVAKPETERLTLTEPTASGDDTDTSVPLGQGVNHILTCSTGHGSTLRCSRFGSFTDPARHGFDVIRLSSTAALDTAETLVNTVRT
jgi:hypothetical protein